MKTTRVSRWCGFLLEQVLQLCERRIGLFGAVTAIFFVEVLSAVDAQTEAIGFTEDRKSVV